VPGTFAERPVVVVGAGVAGLATALALAPLPVLLLAKGRLGLEAATGWAQGGIAAALGPDDAPELHALDTLAAGAGLSDEAVARRVAAAAPACIQWLVDLGAPFDRDATGALALGLEAAHRRRRIVHAAGDGSGRVVLATLLSAARATPSIELVEGAAALELTVAEGRANGLYVQREGRVEWFAARAVVLATGGLGGLYAHTTNPLGARGEGLALAARAGAVLRDVEFVQFHPTAIAAGRDPMPLATEALRGEGAVLVDETGRRFMADVPGAELAPRDVVARAIWAELEAGRRVFLDARASLGTRFFERFPSVTALCRDVGIDPANEPIPVRPAAHYHMGGIAVNDSGRSSLAGLWACGEVAATGLHGANRLASNSLVEALAYARWIAEDIAGESAAAGSPVVLPPAPPAGGGMPTALARMRAVMDARAGVIRDADGLAEAVRLLTAPAFEAEDMTLRNAALAALFVATAALRREESRGGHCRRDFPAAGPAPGRPSFLAIDDLPQPERPAYGLARRKAS